MRYLLDVDQRIHPGKIEEAWDLPAYITFTGSFNEKSAREFRLELERTELHAKRSKQDIIPVVIDSYGGDVYALMSMIDAMEQCELPIATIVEGKAMSCGAILFTCGTEGYRYVGPNATIMIHDVSSLTFGKEPEIRADAEESTRLNEKVYAIMARNCGHDDPKYFYNKITEKRGADWFITPEEAKWHNIANQVKVPTMKITASLNFRFE